MTLIDDYLDESEKYANKYGENTAVLMQVGHFYEAYAVDNDKERPNADNLYRLSDMMNIQMTRKNKSVVENNRGNPLMIGVNIYSIDKFVQILLNNFYTIVIIDQTSQPPYVKREVTNIYSPGTNIKFSSVGETNHLVTIYIEEIENKQKFQTNFCCGISAIDLSTGKNKVYETFSRKDDQNFALDELFKFIQVYDPKELVLVKKNVNISDSKLFSYLHLSDRIVHIKEVDSGECDNQFFNLNYQTTFLARVFKNRGLLSPIEFIGLENMPFALNSYIFLLQFAYEHSEQIIQNLVPPDIWQLDRHLSLTNNTINQLNLVADPSLNCKSKFNSLFAVINNTSTTIGKRYLRDRLLNPIVNRVELNRRYDLIDALIGSDAVGVPVYKHLEGFLNKIIDLERAHRKMTVGLLHPADLCGLVSSYDNIITTFEYLSGLGDIVTSLIPSKEIVDAFMVLINEIKHDFNFEECVKYHQDKITGNIFNEGVFPEIDQVCAKIAECFSNFDGLNRVLSKTLLTDKDTSCKSGGGSDDPVLKLEHNERDGYYLSTTQKRGAVLKKAMLNTPSFEIGGNVVNNDLEFKNPTKTTTKIVSAFLKENSNRLVATMEKLKSMARTRFLGRIAHYSEHYTQTMHHIAKFVGELDVSKSACKTASTYGYKRPKIVDDAEVSDSFILAKDIRHPIIERLGNDHEYVANDIAVGLDMEPDKFHSFVASNLGEENALDTILNGEQLHDTKGMLLFGTNASGKSSLMKAVGLNIIMAQSGFFVPCKAMAFKPYHSLFTRINNNDNIFKGESSFAVEMSELRSILKRADRNSLVLGDELCAGTESISALSIFSSAVVKMEERRTSFIFATHLHELCNITQVTKLEKVKMFHLKVIFSPENDMLVYDRKLTPGNGPAMYGLEVCRAMKMEPDFLLLSEEIRKDLMGVKQAVLDNKQSKYNAQVYVHLCEVCSADAEDVHHIKFQCTADMNKMIDGAIQKDAKSNLVPLCKACHNRVHNGGLKVFGFKMTSNGTVLDWIDMDKEQTQKIVSSLGTEIEVKTKGKKKKYSEEQIDIIINVNREHKTGKKTICDYLESKHGIKISVGTMNKIVKGDY
jgi:DNA mismatch repair protein MutS